MDKEGYISIFQPYVEKLLNINSKEVIGKHINTVLPRLELLETLYSGIEEIEVIKNIQDKKIMVPNTHKGKQ